MAIMLSERRKGEGGREKEAPSSEIAIIISAQKTIIIKEEMILKLTEETAGDASVLLAYGKGGKWDIHLHMSDGGALSSALRFLGPRWGKGEGRLNHRAHHYRIQRGGKKEEGGEGNLFCFQR